MERRVLSCRFNGNNSKERVFVGNKRKQRSEKEPRREERVFNLNTKDKAERKTIEVRGGSLECKVGVRHEVFEKLHKRLRSIEEDTGFMKKAILRCVEERNMLMSEIAGQFHYIKGCLVCSKGGDSSVRVSSFVNPQKDGRKTIGLSEVLLQYSKPPLVTRDFKVNLDASQDLARPF